MKSNWLHIIKERLLKDQVKPPADLWNQVADSLWEDNLRQEFSKEHVDPPTHISQSILKNIQSFSVQSSLGLKTVISKVAAAIIGVVSIATTLYVALNSDNDNVPLAAESASLNGASDTDSSSPSHSNPKKFNPIQPVVSDSLAFFEGNKTTPVTQFGVNASDGVQALPISPETNNKEASGSEHSSVIGSNELGIIERPAQNVTFAVDTFELHYLAFRSKILAATEILAPQTDNNPIKPLIQGRMNGAKVKNMEFGMGVSYKLEGPKLVKETRFKYLEFMPFQRIYGVDASWKKGMWHWGMSAYRAQSNYALTLTDVPFYRSPVRVVPPRRLVIVKSEYHNKEIQTEISNFIPNGTRPDDTVNYYRINYSENWKAKGFDIPFYGGVILNLGRLQLMPGIGGTLWIARQFESSLKIEVQNPMKSTFEFQNEHVITGKRRWNYFAQLQAHYRVYKNFSISANAMMPFIEGKPNWDPGALQWQGGLYVNF